MRAISATTLFGRLVHLDVLDDQTAGIEAFGVRICLCVLEQAEEEFGGFLGPAGFRDAELFPYTVDIRQLMFSLRSTSLVPL